MFLLLAFVVVGGVLCVCVCVCVCVSVHVYLCYRNVRVVWEANAVGRKIIMWMFVV